MARAWERTLSRLLAGIISSLVLTLAVVLGLLTVPSTCACGAELPHTHALYLLAHHHHDESGRVDDAEQAAASSSAPGIVDVESGGATVQGMAESTLADAFAAAIALAAMLAEQGRLMGLVVATRRPCSREITPESPPPRASTACRWSRRVRATAGISRRGLARA